MEFTHFAGKLDNELNSGGYQNSTRGGDHDERFKITP